MGTNRGQNKMHLSTPKRWTDGWGVYVYTPSVPFGYVGVFRF